MVGHQKQLQFLKKSAELGKLSHAYLFCGQSKIGKRTLALEWASFLLGQDAENKLCADLIFIEPADSDSVLPSAGKNEIKISQVRDLIWKLSLKPSIAPFKVAIVNDCHLMNQESQNAFLKTLEEPKKNTILILISEYPEILLPTIRSRCQIIKFYPLAKKEIKNYLRENKIAEKLILEITEIARGRVGAAAEFLAPEKLDDWRKSILELTKISKADLAARFHLAKELSERNDLPGVLEIWLSYFRDVLISAVYGQGPVAGGYSLARQKNIIQKIQTMISLFSSTNINRRLALEILLLDF